MKLSQFRAVASFYFVIFVANWDTSSVIRFVKGQRMIALQQLIFLSTRVTLKSEILFDYGFDRGFFKIYCVNYYCISTILNQLLLA